MIADLLELHQRAEHQSATANTFGLIDTLEHVVDHLLVQRGLFGRERNLLPRFHQRRKIADDFWISLEAAKNERSNQQSEPLGLPLVAVAFHW